MERRREFSQDAFNRAMLEFERTGSYVDVRGARHSGNPLESLLNFEAEYDFDPQAFAQWATANGAAPYYDGDGHDIGYAHPEQYQGRGDSGPNLAGNGGSFEDQLRGLFNQAFARDELGRFRYGSRGLSFADAQQAGNFINSIAPVTIGGQQWHRVREDFTRPGYFDNDMRNPDVAQFLRQYNPADVYKYDPEYGHLMREDKYREFAQARTGQSEPGGWMSDNSAIDSYNKTIGIAMGASGLIGAGLTAASAGAGASTFGPGLADFATGALANAGGAGVPYQSLWSSLGANAASQGGSWADIMSTLGSSDAPWGVNPRVTDFAVDPSTGDIQYTAGSTPFSTGLNWNDIVNQYGGAAGTAAGGATFAGTMSDLLSQTGGQSVNNLGQEGFRQSLAPNFTGMTPAFTGAGTTGLGVSGAAGLLDTIGDWITSKDGLKAISTAALGAGSLYASGQQADAARAAAGTQAGAAQAGIDEQRRQFDKLVQLFSPYVAGGTKALGAQLDLLGLNGAAPQASSIKSLENSPQFGAYSRLGEDAILSKASATGGLRGGNTQGALAQFRPQLLSQLIEQQLGNLGGVTRIGQASAAGQASGGSNISSNIANLLQQQGAATAGGQLAQGSAARNSFGDLLKLGAVIGGFF